ncbi:putative radical SAM protein YgiQ [Hydrogenophaga sp. T4]|nr:putative radical SAM protein YgiQ [Hydrogenophaga sp. T4]
MNAPVDVSFFARAAKPLTSYRPYWAKRFGVAPFLPMSRAEMEQLGWDSCDIVLVTGDAYIDHPSFGMAVIGRVLEAQFSRRHHRPARLAERRALQGAGQAQSVLGRDRGEHGFHDQPLHG